MFCCAERFRSAPEASAVMRNPFLPRNSDTTWRWKASSSTRTIFSGPLKATTLPIRQNALLPNGRE